ncbi:MAG: ferritin-like domain-containing protein [Candidatus Binatia bacterium]
MGLFRRLFTSGDARLQEEVLTGLVDDYNAEVRLAQQLRLHAEEAPYPHAADRLQQLAALEEAQAERLRNEILRLGGSVAPPEPSVRSARNHWARLVCDLEDEQAAGKRYLDQAVRWEEAYPETADLLRNLGREEQTHRVWIQDLIARSDPQAIN